MKLWPKSLRCRIVIAIVVTFAASVVIVGISLNSGARTEPVLAVRFDGIRKSGNPSKGIFIISNDGRAPVLPVFFRLWTTPDTNRELVFETNFFDTLQGFRSGEHLTVEVEIPPHSISCRGEFEFSQYSTKRWITGRLFRWASKADCVDVLQLFPWLWSGRYWVRQVSTDIQSLPPAPPHP